ncbi:hypothetical protein [Paraburkholderia ferrariae]|uniref:Uncharacterized protein n=1 Tax=Paraburkholderia ferrariae TaxID=386056 RepID=A0ABU9S1A6_9BURK
MDAATVGTVVLLVSGGYVLIMGPGLMLMTIVGGIWSTLRGDA